MPTRNIASAIASGETTLTDEELAASAAHQEETDQVALRRKYLREQRDRLMSQVCVCAGGVLARPHGSSHTTPYWLAH